MFYRHTLLVMMLTFVVLLGTFFPVEAESGDRDIFDQKLSKFISLAVTQDAPLAEIGLASEELVQFASAYPESEFASDAQVVPVLLTFLGASAAGEKDKAESLISKMEMTVAKYPKGRLSGLTCERFKKLLGAQSSGVIYIPYQYLPVYMKGDLAMNSRQLQPLIDNFLLLKVNLDFDKDISGSLANEIYTPLLLAYKGLGKWEDFHALANEAKNKFPNNKPLLQTIERLASPPKPKT